jgi:hypothetical protein
MLSLSNPRYAYGNFHSCQISLPFAFVFSMPVQVFQYLCVLGFSYRSKLRFQSEKHQHTSSVPACEGLITLLFLVLSGSRIRPSLSIYGSTALADLGRFFNSLIYTQSVELLGRGISPPQGRYLLTEQHKHRINAHRHPCLAWDSNPRPQYLSGRRQFMP